VYCEICFKIRRCLDLVGWQGDASFEPIDISDSQELEARFITNEKGDRIGSIRGRHSSMVTARKI
jgi:hypothetical protein